MFQQIYLLVSLAADVVFELIIQSNYLGVGQGYIILGLELAIDGDEGAHLGWRNCQTRDHQVFWLRFGKTKNHALNIRYLRQYFIDLLSIVLVLLDRRAIRPILKNDLMILDGYLSGNDTSTSKL